MKLVVPMAAERSAGMSTQIRSTGRGFEREIIQVRIPGDTINRGGAAALDNGQAVVADTVTTEKPGEVANIPHRVIVDREKVCPFLLRVFPNLGRQHSVSLFARGGTPDGELIIYTWMDATLKELSGLIREVNKDARMRGTYFEFSVVYPDIKSSLHRTRTIGTTRNGERGLDDQKCLADVRFQIGDFLIVAITPPENQFY